MGQHFQMKRIQVWKNMTIIGKMMDLNLFWPSEQTIVAKIAFENAFDNALGSVSPAFYHI